MVKIAFTFTIILSKYLKNFEFRAYTIENWTVVGRGYFSHASSHSENVASARRVYVNKIKQKISQIGNIQSTIVRNYNFTAYLNMIIKFQVI